MKQKIENKRKIFKKIAWLVIACHSFEQEEEISKRKILTEKNILNSEDQNLLF